MGSSWLYQCPPVTQEPSRSIFFLFTSVWTSLRAGGWWLRGTQGPRSIFCFSFGLGVIPSCAQDLLLASHSRISPGGAYMCGVRDGTLICLVQGKCPACCIISPTQILCFPFYISFVLFLTFRQCLGVLRAYSWVLDQGSLLVGLGRP